jgi:hypothetical protein
MSCAQLVHGHVLPQTWTLQTQYEYVWNSILLFYNKLDGLGLRAISSDVREHLLSEPAASTKLATALGKRYTSAIEGFTRDKLPA